MTAVYRVRQGVRALLAFSTPIDEPLAARYLTPALLALFNLMRRSEQLHSLNVLRALLAQENTPPELATAALLHDVGKSRYPVSLVGRTLPVLVRFFSPALFRQLSLGDPHRFPFRPFAVFQHHPAWSGEMLREAGALEAAAWLAEHHADTSERWHTHPLLPLLQRLQWADDTN